MTASEEPLLPGCLYVVATPIGNLGDLSPRALSLLSRVDLICAEDTRTSGQLLAAFGLHKPMVALHDHNEDRVAARLVADLGAGKTLALISDAGTPLVSDPGYALVKAVREAGLELRAIPGPSALIAALSVAGLPTDEFSFAGFLPARASARRERLRLLAAETRTLVFYEAPHRIVECAEDLATEFGPGRMVCLARELTKRFEQSLRLPAGELAAWLRADDNRQRGEFVLVVAGAPATESRASLSAERTLKVLLAELSPSRAARVAAELTGLKRKPLYELALQLGAAEPGPEGDQPDN
ncbi:MAG: 16S rRNA (cytidine(1402)-2'-O)-methyltransferase [Stagnimonas sp.]|nr:16S rRNA (cytidine(1402)-2'-O)-methyltransferase [Stagnimonas sp.]